MKTEKLFTYLINSKQQNIIKLSLIIFEPYNPAKITALLYIKCGKNSLFFSVRYLRIIPPLLEFILIEIHSQLYSQDISQIIRTEKNDAAF